MREQPAFDQRGQTVTYQYNAIGDINFQNVASQVDAVSELQKLLSEFDRAKDGHALNEQQAAVAHTEIEMALEQARKPQPDKETVLKHLSKAKSVIAIAATATNAASGLVTALAVAADMVKRWFQ